MEMQGPSWQRPDGAASWVDWLDAQERASKYLREAAWVTLLACGAGAEYPRVSRHDDEQAAYVAQRLDGAAHRLAEMLATATPPGAMTDREFLYGHCNGNQFEATPEAGDAYRRVAEANGQDTTGKVYVSGLAEYPGDPRAWVSGRGDVARVLDERGWGAEGAVSRPVTRVGEPMNCALAEDIIEDKLLDVIDAAGDDARGLNLADEREKIVRRHKPHWAD